MYSNILLAVTSLILIYYIIIPIITYIRDPKGLRKYPNFTFWSGISDLPLIYTSHQGFRSHSLLEAHRKHPVLRIGPNALSYSDPQAIKDIYGHGTKCTKDVFYDKLSGTHFHLADVVDKSEHARKRKVLSSAYALRNLENWEFKVADMSGKVIKAFDAHCAKPGSREKRIDYRMWTNLFTIAAIANIGLSEDLHFLDQGSDLVISEQMDGSTKKVHFRECLGATGWATSNLIWSYDWYETLKRISGIVSSTYREKWALNKDWDGIVYNRATTRMKRYENGEKLDDFFTALMNDKNGTPHNLEWGEIIAEVSIMMNAGSDTTGIALTNVMYNLLKHPHCMAQLRTEIDAALSDDDTVAPYDKIKHLPYLRACLDESLRMYPPVSFHVPRRTPAEGAKILDDFISGDTSVGISAYVVHRDETIFPEPETFRPERWLGEGGKELQPYFVAFSAGARGCIGRNISYLEQTVLLASLVRRFEFELVTPDWEPTIRETTNLASGPMPLKMWRRDLSA